MRGRTRDSAESPPPQLGLGGEGHGDRGRCAGSLVTNGDTPLSPRYVRRAHEQLIGLLCRYLAATRKPGAAIDEPPPPPAVSTPAPAVADREDLEDLEDPDLDAEIAPTP